MRFRLRYRGLLRPHRVGDKDDPDKMAPHVHAVRRVFHPQLKQLWATNRFLSSHESYPSDYGLPALPDGGRLPLVDMVACSHALNGFRFVPLVRGDWSLNCSLSILFLKRDLPGSQLVHRGDLDNRLKTLIDALRYPETPRETGGATPGPGEDPFFCLLQKDEYITGLSVETDHLLEPLLAGEDESYVDLVITVDVKPYTVTMFNLAFS